MIYIGLYSVVSCFLSVSQSQLRNNITKDGNVKLKCSLWGYLLASCTDKTLVWVKDTGNQLVEDASIQQQMGKLDHCVSTLTVKHSRTKYTCQFFEGSIMKIEAHYSPVWIGTILLRHTEKIQRKKS